MLRLMLPPASLMTPNLACLPHLFNHQPRKALPHRMDNPRRTLANLKLLRGRLAGRLCRVPEPEPL